MNLLLNLLLLFANTLYFCLKFTLIVLMVFIEFIFYIKSLKEFFNKMYLFYQWLIIYNIRQ